MAPPRMTFSEISHLPPLSAGIYKLSDNTILKARTHPDHIDEAEVLRFVRSRTSIPIPDVIDVYSDALEPERGYLVLSQIPGETLKSAWPNMSSSHRASVETQLRDYIAQMRSIKGTAISAPNGHGHVVDDFFEQNDDEIIRGPFGPFENEAAFNEGLIRMLRAREGSGVFAEMVGDMLRSIPPREVVFTHGQLDTKRILVRDGAVVGILEWEMAGFRPEYWEYVKALHWPSWEEPWIKERVWDRVLRPWHLELAVMREVQSVYW